ncbi:MAG: DNA polymerase IV [Burkholderiales bacterium]|jgi:DNA polymerase-4|nr:DNA polymerase IV [Burkholderiales bacterium]
MSIALLAEPDPPPPTGSARVIAHLDMDAFYASVELLRAPQLRDLPIVVGGGRRRSEHRADAPADAWPRLRSYAGRGVVTTATYAARAFGVHSGMPLMHAARLAPDALLLPADFDEYRRCSRLFKATVRTLAPIVEDRGIDEIYLDLGAQVDAVDGPRARALACAIKDAVRRDTGLTCSIGLAPNKLIAKIASDLDKPDGLTIVTAADVATRLWPLPARRIGGIGPKAAAKLAGFGIDTIGALAAADPEWLIAQFGRSTGAWMHAAAHGRDDRPVVTASEPRSVSRETTFDRDLHPVHDRDALSAVFTELCTKLAADLARKGVSGRTIGIRLRYDDFRTVTRDHSLDVPVADAVSLRRVAGRCLKRVALDRRLRLLGVRVSNLAPAGDARPYAPAAFGTTQSLFEPACADTRAEATATASRTPD